VRILRLAEKACETYLSELDKRTFSEDVTTDRKVRSILNDVRERGDEALLHYTRLYDRISLSPKNLEVKGEEVREAHKRPRHFRESRPVISSILFIPTMLSLRRRTWLRLSPPMAPRLSQVSGKKTSLRFSSIRRKVRRKG